MEDAKNDGASLEIMPSDMEIKAAIGLLQDSNGVELREATLNKENEARDILGDAVLIDGDAVLHTQQMPEEESCNQFCKEFSKEFSGLCCEECCEECGRICSSVFTQIRYDLCSDKFCKRFCKEFRREFCRICCKSCQQKCCQFCYIICCKVCERLFRETS